MAVNYVRVCYFHESYPCKICYLNCMMVKDSATVFKKLYQEITGKALTGKRDPTRSMEKCLTTSKSSMCVRLVVLVVIHGNDVTTKFLHFLDLVFGFFFVFVGAEDCIVFDSCTVPHHYTSVVRRREQLSANNLEKNTNQLCPL
ncbi:hypothetical protein LOTGIDRAFT_172272 [Lottia gigantea]|uniref:Uncharacterized protein n=1 Tax=Lottia gigantea TaxID=225164 RepID=V4AWP2_LOTGI|nr:hypothetical protein LOTGIDRAFT_172272 [Lottia gigantea]ESP01898.1 hypothetical protein LOTGIDRAFT_172272 [Lottia gigantea]